MYLSLKKYYQIPQYHFLGLIVGVSYLNSSLLLFLSFKKTDINNF